MFTSGYILNKNEASPLDKTENFDGVEKSEGYPKLGKHIPAAVGGAIDGMPRYPSFSSAPGILRASDYFGTVIFAISGSITAASCGLDLFGDYINAVTFCEDSSVSAVFIFYTFFLHISKCTRYF